jgi:hypothetical protein
MRILVQDEAGKVYFDGVEWTDNESNAKEFESVALAESLCREHGFSNVLIVVKSKNGSQEISYRVGGRNALLVSKPPTTRIQNLY